MKMIITCKIRVTTLLCRKHQKEISQCGKYANNSWERLISKGCKAHNSHNFHSACKCFGAASDIANLQLKQNNSAHSHRFSAVDMLVIAGQNLAAALCAQEKLSSAEKTLSRLHSDIRQLCSDKKRARDLRLDALGNLDKTLFALTSLLSAAGQTELIHQTINQAETTATLTAQELFH